MRAHYTFVMIALVLLVIGCQGQENLGDHSCPTGSSVTYESFGKEFFGTWCQSCHGAAVTNRNGAPDDIFFDTRDDIWALREQVFAQTADANKSMPIGPHGPSDDDRKRLADWLACGAP